MVFLRRADDLDPPLYSTNYPLRMFVSARAIVIGSIALFEDASISYADPVLGVVAMLLLIGLGCVGLADAVINDVLPRRFSLRWMAEHRHVGFIVLAVIDLGITIIVVTRGYLGTALLALLLDAAAAIWIAIYHVRHRYVVPRARAGRWRDDSKP